MSGSSLEVNKKYLILGKKCVPHKRGAYVIAKRFSDENSECDFLEDQELKKLSDADIYKKVIVTYQVPDQYHKKLTPHLIREEDNFLFYLRNTFYAKLCNSASNGFSYYSSKKSHKNFIPYICDYPYKFYNPSELTIGFYLRPGTISDSFYFLTDYLMMTKKKVNLITCGEINYKFCPELYTSLNFWRHTFETEDFFNSITHYLCPMSAEKEDPFPNMLMEAIQTNKQIICPRIEGRNHKDGIDDILSLLSGGYHHNLNNLEIYYENKNHGLTSANFQKFNQKIFENNWENKLDYTKYKSFYDWCSCEL